MTFTDRSVLFVDASKQFRKEGSRNYLDKEHVTDIVNTVYRRRDLESKAHLASFEEIANNDFNLNIPRYVDSTIAEEEIDISATLTHLAELHRKEVVVDKELSSFFYELGIAFNVGAK